MAGAMATKQVLVWVEALAENGLFVVGPDGAGDFTPEARKMVEALHELLAGGDVEVSVKTPGKASTRDELNAKLEEAMKAANVSAAGGGPIVFSP